MEEEKTLNDLINDHKSKAQEFEQFKPLDELYNRWTDTYNLLKATLESTNEQIYELFGQSKKSQSKGPLSRIYQIVREGIRTSYNTRYALRDENLGISQLRGLLKEWNNLQQYINSFNRLCNWIDNYLPDVLCKFADDTTFLNPKFHVQAVESPFQIKAYAPLPRPTEEVLSPEDIEEERKYPSIVQNIKESNIGNIRRGSMGYGPPGTQECHPLVEEPPIQNLQGINLNLQNNRQHVTCCNYNIPSNLLECLDYNHKDYKGKDGLQYNAHCQCKNKIDDQTITNFIYTLDLRKTPIRSNALKVYLVNTKNLISCFELPCMNCGRNEKSWNKYVLHPPKDNSCTGIFCQKCSRILIRRQTNYMLSERITQLTWTCPCPQNTCKDLLPHSLISRLLPIEFQYHLKLLTQKNKGYSVCVECGKPTLNEKKETERAKVAKGYRQFLFVLKKMKACECLVCTDCIKKKAKRYDLEYEHGINCINALNLLERDPIEKVPSIKKAAQTAPFGDPYEEKNNTTAVPPFLEMPPEVAIRQEKNYQHNRVISHPVAQTTPGMPPSINNANLLIPSGNYIQGQGRSYNQNVGHDYPVAYNYNRDPRYPPMQNPQPSQMYHSSYMQITNNNVIPPSINNFPIIPSVPPATRRPYNG